MTTAYSWHESYRAAALETDWAKVRERIKAAEADLHERQRVLSLDHGGTPEERQAIAAALSGLKGLRNDVAVWGKTALEVSGGDAHTRKPVFSD